MPATKAELYQPVSVAVDSAGNLYIADFHNNRVRMVTAATGLITTVAGNGTGDGLTGPEPGQLGGLAVAATVSPYGIAVDSSGNIYISDMVFVLKVTAATGIITVYAGNGDRDYNGDNIPATSAALSWPNGLAVDTLGNLYIVEETVCMNGWNSSCDQYTLGSSRIRKVDAVTGIITTVAGNGVPGFSGDGGPAIDAQIGGELCCVVDFYLENLAVDAAGNLYIADTLNNRIREVTASNGIINTVAGNGTEGFSGDGGLAINAELNYPSGVAVDGSGNIYIADAYNNRIRVVGGDLTPNIYKPLYQVVSVLYAPPGNKSSQGYGTTTTNGASAQISQSFASGTSESFSWSFLGFLSGGGSMGSTTTSGNSYSFTENFSNATALTTDDITNTAFNPTNSNVLNHNLDTIEIWLNPQVTVWMSGTTPETYTVTSQPTIIDGTPTPYASVVGVPAITMEAAPAGITTLNPTGAAGVTTVPVDFLIPYALSQEGVNSPPVYVPGLGAICAANLIGNNPNPNGLYYQQLAADQEIADSSNPTATPPSICTQANQCGCVPSDFAGILAADPLLNYNSATHTATPHPGTTDPLTLDGSGASVCGDYQSAGYVIPPNSDCRYVIVPIAVGSNVPQICSLSGTQSNSCQWSDSSTATFTSNMGMQYSVSTNYGVGFFGMGLKTTNTWTWTQSESTGNSTGHGNQTSVTLNTSTAECAESVNIYEDTVYHTLVFQVPPGVPNCP
jgi:sugar lactone lactonase YvrE